MSGMLSFAYVWWIIFGMICGRSSMTEEPGPGTSARVMASSAPSTKRSVISTQTLYTRKLMVKTLNRTNVIIPRRIAAGTGSCVIDYEDGDDDDD